MLTRVYYRQPQEIFNLKQIAEARATKNEVYQTLKRYNALKIQKK